MIMSIIGALLGAGLGYLIGKNFSRLGAGCPILCNPKISTIYFAIVGLILASGW